MGFSNTVEGSQFPAELPKLNFDPKLTQTPDCVIPNCPLTLSELIYPRIIKFFVVKTLAFDLGSFILLCS
jgi:hypothetical protein